MASGAEDTHVSATTAHLLGRIKDGDEAALNDLFERYFGRLLVVVRLRVGPTLRTELESVDVVRNAFLASLKSLDDFTYPSEGSFFHSICSLTEKRIRDVVEDARTTIAMPATQTQMADDVMLLEAAIDKLTDEQREAILLVRYEGMSLSEAAEVMSSSAENVKMLVAHAMLALGRSLGTIQ
jgi:RNA polymerase sigma-70 factor, ECF subfamily